MTRRALGAIVIALTLTLAGCSETPEASTESGLPVLQADTAAVRSAVGARDEAGSTDALARLRADVIRLRDSNAITAERADRILAAADDVETELAGFFPLATTTAAETSPVSGLPGSLPIPTTAGSPGQGPEPDQNKPDKDKPGKDNPGKDNPGNGNG
ncbi:hypothetical protein [Rhodococcus zopfii]|uniref:hypothetical protein n=1 Tax=Rhodococcus zopfii TaxID=43772 RepID=UPI00093446AB|nr:hypothetical protein [Rhodococcus zopfii]